MDVDLVFTVNHQAGGGPTHRWLLSQSDSKTNPDFPSLKGGQRVNLGTEEESYHPG